MAVVTSIINLKGGVGKTTLTLALAHYLAGEHGKRVLVIDLDPQTNATIALVTERRWRERDQGGQTLYQLFKDQLDGTQLFSPRDAILTRVSNVNGGIPGLDLLPSSIRLHRIQDKITKIADLDTFRGGPVFALRDSLREVLPHYDHVLIDCPPNLGVITLNGIALSRYFLIPVVPDILSTLRRPASARPHGRLRPARAARDLRSGHHRLALPPDEQAAQADGNEHAPRRDSGDSPADLQ